MMVKMLLQADTKIQSLMSRIRRLEAEQQALKDELANAAKLESVAKSAVADAQGRMSIGSLLHKKMREQLFHGLHIGFRYIAWDPDFADLYASDVRRLLSFACAQEIDLIPSIAASVKSHAAAIRDVFDPLHYLTRYDDVADDCVNPLLHYSVVGHTEGRQPNPLFDPSYYRQQALSLTIDPLLHYVTEGSAAGLKPHPLFDPTYYAKQVGDDRRLSKMTTLTHYQVFGGRARLNPSRLFHTAYYLDQFPTSEEIECPLEFYLETWRDFPRSPHPLFDARYFSAVAKLGESSDEPISNYCRNRNLHQYSTHPLLDLDYVEKSVRLQTGKAPLEAFLEASEEADIDPHPLFNSALYRYQLEVERTSKLTEPAVVHYLWTGFLDHALMPNVLFDAEAYVRRNKWCDGDAPALVHYITQGDAAGFATHEIFAADHYWSQIDRSSSEATALENFLAKRDAITDPRMARKLDPFIINFIESVPRNREFDVRFYKLVHPDLAHLSDEDATQHYFNDGKAEGRWSCAAELLRRTGARIRDIPLGFAVDEYILLNPDLAVFADAPVAALGHFLEAGHRENRLHGLYQLHLEGLAVPVVDQSSPLRITNKQNRTKVAVLIHLFYPDLWSELAGFASNFSSVTHDVFINVVDLAWTSEFQSQLRSLAPGAFVQLSNDSGRDIGGFSRLLDNIDLNKYDTVALLHSKKSPHIPYEKAVHWRRGLVSAFAANPEVVRQCVELFQDDPLTGIVASQKWRCDIMGNNFDQCIKLFDLLEIKEEFRKLDYVSGTMFLVRADIMKRMQSVLTKVQWEYGGDNVLDHHVDGQIAHAVERVLPSLARQMGYHIVWR